MKMEEKAVVLEKESWSINMTQRFDDELCKMKDNVVGNSVFLTKECTTYGPRAKIGLCIV